MKFVLFCEGHTEVKALPDFLKRWLDNKLKQPVRVKTVRFNGWKPMWDDLIKNKKPQMYLGDPDVIGVIALLDLYGPDIYPDNLHDAPERYDWAKKELEGKVNHVKFRQFFAVHEIEAWLLSDPKLFPAKVRSALPAKAQHQAIFG